MNGCFSGYVGSVMNWQLVQGVPYRLPNIGWDRPQPPMTLQRLITDDGWAVDGQCEYVSKLAIAFSSTASVLPNTALSCS